MDKQKKDYYQEIRSVYDNAAVEREGYYDSKPGAWIRHHTIWQYLNRLHTISILNSFKQKNSLHSCLDAGCGMGDFTYTLGRRYHYQQVHGIDFSAPMLKLARKKYGKHRAPFLSFSRGDLAEKLAFKDRSFDLSLCLNTFQQILPDDQKRLIHELCRVSRHLVILEIKRYHFLHQLLTGYKAMGYLKIYPTNVPRVTALFQETGFYLSMVRPIFFFISISPIALLVFSRRKNVETR